MLSLNDIISSNTIELEASDDTYSYEIKGAEITFKKKKYIHDLGYSFITTDENIASQYFYIVFLLERKPEGYSAPYARIIAYLDNKLELKGEMVSTENIYFINSSYNFFKNRALHIKQGTVPGIFTLEKESQKVVAVTNTISKKILWTANNLSYHDKKAMIFFTGAMQTMEFSVGETSRLFQRRRTLLDNQEIKQESKFIIQESNMLPPESLDNNHLIEEE